MADTLAGTVNAGRVIGINGPYVEVTSSAASTGQSGGLALGSPTLIATSDGSATVTVDIQSPLWAEFDRVEYYINSAQYAEDHDVSASTPPLYRAGPDVIQIAGTDFTITTVDDFPSIPGAQHLEATTSLTLTGLTQDTWVVVLVRGTDAVSKPLFPVVPNDLRQTGNTTLAQLTDGNLGEDGVPAMAFGNPLFISVTNDGDYDAPGLDLTPTVDTDQDGCANAREQASRGQVGGLRDYLDFWDFYDVWEETGPSVWQRNKTINVFGDIVGVALRFGAVHSTPYLKNQARADALTPPTSASGYHAAFDRGAQTGANPWNAASPDGAINVFDDILGVARQFGHSCA
jgi:hypothetical protein